MAVRRPSFAGAFYPDDPASLQALLERFFSAAADVSPCYPYGIVVPHAGIAISGRIAARSFAAIDPAFYGTIVVIGPSHAGYPTCTSTLDWGTPLGTVKTNQTFVEALPLPKDDEVMAARENSLEVMMPFIRYRFPHGKVAPVLMGNQSYEPARRVADAIVQAQKATGEEIVLVASSDYSHYVMESVAKRHDLYVIEALLALDMPEMYRRIREEAVSTCGYGPVTAMVEASRQFGATRAELLDYGTSAEVTGDHSQVVGYAAVVVV